MGAPTTNFGFTKPTVGGDADVWGGSTNTNWDTLDAQLAYLSSGFIYGLTLSNNGSDATNDIDIATGVAFDSTNVKTLRLSSAITKRLDASWAVGTNQGGLDTGSIADTTYHVWLIMRSDTGVVDALFSTSASSPTMPANYDYKRRIGSIIRVSSAIKAFKQYGNGNRRRYRWNAMVQDVNATNPGTSAVLRTLTVPAGIKTLAIMLVYGVNGSGNHSIYISDPDLTDQAAGSPNRNNLVITSSGNIAHGVIVEEYTDTSSRVRSRQDASGVSDTFGIGTVGFWDEV